MIYNIYTNINNQWENVRVTKNMAAERKFQPTGIDNARLHFEGLVKLVFNIYMAYVRVLSIK